MRAANGRGRTQMLGFPVEVNSKWAEISASISGQLLPFREAKAALIPFNSAGPS